MPDYNSHPWRVSLGSVSINPTADIPYPSATGQQAPLKVDQYGRLWTNSTVNTNTTAVASAASPSYTEGTPNPLSMDLNGDLRVAGVFSASSTLKSTAADPSYNEGTSNPFSSDLNGYLRTWAKIAGSLPTGTNAIGGVTQAGIWNVGFTAPQHVIIDSATLGTVAVTGGLTDAQLRASAVPVSGAFWQATQPVSGTVAISGTVATADAAAEAALSTIATNTTGIALESGGNLDTIAARLLSLLLSQGSDGSSVSGPIVQGRVNDTPENYVAGEVRPISLTNEGRVRVAVTPAMNHPDFIGCDIDFGSTRNVFTGELSNQWI